MLTVTNSGGFGGFGATPAELGQVPALAATGQSLADSETRLRNSFGRLLLVLEALQTANKTVPPAFTALMQKFNVAQQAYTEAANFWLIARAGTDKAQLPDPASVPQEVPKFDLPANGFGAALRPSAVGIIYGDWGNTRRVALGEYMPYHYANGFGAFPIVAIFIIALVAITGAVIISVFGKSQAAADIAANQAATAKALARQAEVESDERALSNIINTCVGQSTDPTRRFECTELALQKFPDVQAGRPSGDVPGTTKSSVFAVIGVIAVLSVAGTAGYLLFRRRKHAQAALPRAYARSSAASHDGDDDETT